MINNIRNWFRMDENVKLLLPLILLISSLYEFGLSLDPSDQICQQLGTSPNHQNTDSMCYRRNSSIEIAAMFDLHLKNDNSTVRCLYLCMVIHFIYMKLLLLWRGFFSYVCTLCNRAVKLSISLIQFSGLQCDIGRVQRGLQRSVLVRAWLRQWKHLQRHIIRTGNQITRRLQFRGYG